jgi:hypothetical protein
MGMIVFVTLVQKAKKQKKEKRRCYNFEIKYIKMSLFCFCVTIEIKQSFELIIKHLKYNEPHKRRIESFFSFFF